MCPYISSSTVVVRHINSYSIGFVGVYIVFGSTLSSMRKLIMWCMLMYPVSSVAAQSGLVYIALHELICMTTYIALY